VIYHQDSQLMIHKGDALAELRTMQAESIQCCVTSPPYYGLRDYGVDGQIGLEETPEAYIAKLVDVFREVRRVLKDDGTCWINIGDSYSTHAAGKCKNPMATSTLAGVKTQEVARELKTELPYRNAEIPEKNLIGIPWMLAFALRADGWYLRQDIIWSKPNPMPESVTDRCTKSHEYLFMLSKASRYYYDQEAIKEPAIYADDDRVGRAMKSHKSNPTAQVNGIRPRVDKQRGHSRRHAGFNDRWDSMEKTEQCSGMRNKRSVWTVGTRAYVEAHFATFPAALIEPCILAGSRIGDTVLDPFGGSGTTAEVANKFGRKAVLVELNPEYCELAMKRNCQKVLFVGMEAA
jgi:DNA modification methylase